MMTTKRDYSRANRIATDTVSDWLPGFAEGRHDGDEVWIRSPLREDHSAGSFSVNLSKGVYNDFASGDSGDLLSLYSSIKGISNSQACDEFIARHSELDRAYREATDGIYLDDFLSSIGGPKIGANQRKWLYSDSRCTFYVVRTDHPDGTKDIFPWKFDDEQGKWVKGKPKKPEDGYPILNLQKVRDADTVVVCEGEKKSESIPPEFVATAWSNGAQSVKLHDWTPLRGKKVILWPDNDEPGAGAMDTLQGILKGLACTVLRVMPGQDWAKGADAGDFTIEQNRATLSNAVLVCRPEYPFPLTRYCDMRLTPTKWVIKGIFPDNSLSSIFGAPGSGKSFFAVDVAACVASGAPFHGREIKRDGPVVYIAGEGHDGMSKRFRAWELSRGQSLADLPLHISHFSTSLCDDGEMEKLTATVKLVGEEFGPVALIVIDTWARNMGGDENSTSDTVAAIRAADKLRGIYNCAALVVHHSGKANNDAGRGSNALFGALDTEYKIERKGSNVIVQSTKMKDGQAPGALTFALESVDLNIVDEDGDEVTSAALKEIELSGIIGDGKSGKGKNQSVVIEALKSAGGFMNRHELQKSIQDKVNYDAFKKVLKALERDKIVTIDTENNVILS